MATKAARKRESWETAEQREARVPGRTRRHRRSRDERFAREAKRAKPENGPTSLLADPDYHMARSCGWDVMRKELRKPEPPGPYYDPAQKLRNPDGSETVLPSKDCASWLWWKSLESSQRHDLYEVTHAGEPPSAVQVFNMGLEISNPQFVVESW